MNSRQPPARPRRAASHAPLPSHGKVNRWLFLHALALGTAFSFAAHALLVSLGFIVPPPAPRKHDDEGIKVVLVNAKHALPPKNAKHLAQTNLDGGGNTEQEAMPSSPLPPDTRSQEGDALVEAKQRVEQLEALQRELLTQARNARAAININKSQPDQAQAQPDARNGSELTEQQRAITRQQAVVERELREYAQRPRKTFIGPRTKEYRFAQYVDDWRQRVEKVGTLHYPKAATRKAYSLLVSMEIRSDGSVSNVDIARSSGNRSIDDTARRIIQLASPFAPFPKDIRKDTDVLVVTRTWTFSAEQMKTEN